MKAKQSLIIFSILIWGISNSSACDFLPKNNIYISKFSEDTNGMTQETFDRIINRVYDSYAPIIAAKGATLQMINKWDDGTLNAYADRDGGNGYVWHVTLYGGLARHPLATDDAFMMVVCHETGHHVGGAPKYGYGNEWAAAEGQADYFAALKCMRRVLEKDDNISIVSKMTVDQEATKKCRSVYNNESEIALCQRIAMAGKSISVLLGSLDGDTKLAFTTPDKYKVRRTDSDHPGVQCRLDTFFQASLCDKSFNEDVSETSPIPGTCTKGDGQRLGMRPLCWYKPGVNE